MHKPANVHILAMLQSIPVVYETILSIVGTHASRRSRGST